VSFWKNKKVLVTGGAGFVGSHVIELLIEEGARVKVKCAKYPLFTYCLRRVGKFDVD
jgi:NADPH:quinone reductase-like Zn-dependent oxidoreductase